MTYFRIKRRSLGQAYARFLAERLQPGGIVIMLFAHGVHSIGLTPIERCRALLARGRRQGGFVGVDEKAYPADFAVFARYHPALRAISGRFPLPEPLSWAQFESFVHESGAGPRMGVTIEDGLST